MPAYNAVHYIADAIKSVLQQSHQNWELIIVNDGSTDGTEDVVNRFSDNRINIITHQHSGVSKSRNVALNKIRGDYFCFLDADDILPFNSLSSRLRVFHEKRNVSFVDGVVLIKQMETNETIKEVAPIYRGNPLNELLKLSEKCFVGNTWMIRREPYSTYNFNEDMKHCEDICFYISIAKDKIYDHTTDRILTYRKRFDSVMTDYSGLEEGYYRLYQYIHNNYNLSIPKELLLKMKIMRIMFLTYLMDGRNPRCAIKSSYQYLTM
jgi:glycosyltransferase involved in cell wall biosynthesis